MKNLFMTIRVAVVGDIHLLHKKTTTEYILANLDKYCTNDDLFSKLDLFVLNGDVFDNLTVVPNTDVGLIQMWFAKVLLLANKYNVIIRILEGTPSHDRKQSQLFTNLYEILKKDTFIIDIKHIKTVEVEYLSKYNLNLLFIPDEYKHHTNDTLIEVKNLIHSKGLDQVDLCFMHGAFTYQLPACVKDNIKHNETEYLTLVKRLIFINHIHKHTNYDRIIAPGSFDRIAQGEEEDKGFYYVIINENDYQVKFIVNKTAKKYITLKCKQYELEECLQYIQNKLQKIPIDSYIRIEAKSTTPIVNNLDLVKKKFPLYHWSIITDKQQIESINNIELSNYTPIIINRDTLPTLVANKLNTFTMDNLHRDKAMEILKEVL